MSQYYVRDEYSQFRQHLKNAKLAAKRKCLVCSMTLEDLKKQWELQEGVCPITGWKLVNRPSVAAGKRCHLVPYAASVDRLHSNRGYEPGNIRFVAYIVNVVKNKFSDGQLIHFCHSVVSVHPHDFISDSSDAQIRTGVRLSASPPTYGDATVSTD